MAVFVCKKRLGSSCSVWMSDAKEGDAVSEIIEYSKEWEKIGKQLLRTRKKFQALQAYHVRVAFLVSDKEKRKNGKLILGECAKVPHKYKWCVPYDFCITMYTENILHFTEEQKKILMYHELSHIGVNEDGNEPSFYIVPHDIEEFTDIIKKYGLDWSG